MKKYRFYLIIVSLIVVITITLGFTLPNRTKNEIKPNVVLILADDQGWGATSVLMDSEIKESASDFYRTPNLYRLAEAGMIFSNGYAPHPNCSPSRAAIITGKSPAKLHFTDIVHRNNGSLYEGNLLIPPKHINNLTSQEITIVEWIRNKFPEYRAAHFGKWHLAGGCPEQHGFDASDGATTNREGNYNPSDDPKKIFSVTKRGMNWMETQVKTGHPFYLQLSYYAVHLGIEAKSETIEKVKNWLPGKRHNQIAHAAMTKNLDQGIGMVLDKIKELGIEDRTYVIYLSDNGCYPIHNPGNTNGPLHGWKATLWEGGIRVPFIIAGPGIRHAYSDVRVTGIDLFPTICSWLSIKDLPAGIDGGSLTEMLKYRGKGKVQRSFKYLVFHFPHYQLQKGNHPVSVIYKGDYKLMKFYEDSSIYLFNLKKDLDETDNIANQKPGMVKKMTAKLNDYLRLINTGMPVKNKNYSIENDPGQKYIKIKERLMKEPYFIINNK